jgi:hypothetical protein
MFEALRTTRRVILSGTPIQNDLGEFHAMVLLVFFSLRFVLILRRLTFVTLDCLVSAPNIARRAILTSSQTITLPSAEFMKLLF